MLSFSTDRRHGQDSRESLGPRGAAIEYKNGRTTTPSGLGGANTTSAYQVRLCREHDGPFTHPFLAPATSWTVVVVNQLLPSGQKGEPAHMRRLAEAR
jgi:hypothetical protein